MRFPGAGWSLRRHAFLIRPADRFPIQRRVVVQGYVHAPGLPSGSLCQDWTFSVIFRIRSQFMVHGFQTSWDAFLASLFSTLNREP